MLGRRGAAAIPGTRTRTRTRCVDGVGGKGRGVFAHHPDNRSGLIGGHGGVVEELHGAVHVRMIFKLHDAAAAFHVGVAHRPDDAHVVLQVLPTAAAGEVRHRCAVIGSARRPANLPDRVPRPRISRALHPKFEVANSIAVAALHGLLRGSLRFEFDEGEGSAAGAPPAFDVDVLDRPAFSKNVLKFALANITGNVADINRTRSPCCSKTSASSASVSLSFVSSSSSFVSPSSPLVSSSFISFSSSIVSSASIVSSSSIVSSASIVSSSCCFVSSPSAPPCVLSPAASAAFPGPRVGAAAAPGHPAGAGRGSLRIPHLAV
eukprot:GHVT01067501.1.p1 GENE.GHVT01067501.1~~GHVT01067501.1.p1  ORF type:complete len:320 (+),score=72.14 GHVT01067501.1:676-1635(+)